MRTCVICGVGIEHRHGLARVCGPACRGDLSLRNKKTYRGRHAEKIAEQERQRKRDPTKRSAQGKVYRAKNSAAIKARKREAYHRDREHILAKMAASYALDGGKKRDRNREQYAIQSAALDYIRELQEKRAVILEMTL